MSGGELGDEEDRNLMAAVARAHYIDDLTRVEIAEQMDISRFRVARLLARAREEGIVTIEINDSGLLDAQLSSELQEALGLEACRVVRSRGNEGEVRNQVGAAAASVLSTTLSAGEVLGVAWGRTLTATTSQLAYLPRLSIVQLTGFIAGDISSSPIEIMRHVWQRAGGEVHPIWAPLFVQDLETARGLWKHPDIQAARELFPQVTTALLSVGAWDSSATQVRDVLPDSDRIGLEAGGAVADIAGIVLREDGQPVDPAFQERCIAISHQELQNVPRVLAVAGGAAKARAVRAVARAGLITELVTDYRLARAVLEGAHG